MVYLVLAVKMAIKPSPMAMQMAFDEQQRQLKIKYSHYLNKEMINWITIYPAYINAKKSISDGRRIQLDRAVDNPTCKEIAEVLNANKFNVLLEDKRYYPRELLKDDLHAGRVRVRFFNDGHDSPLYPEFTTRKSIYLFAADAIKTLKSRQGGSGNKNVSVTVSATNSLSSDSNTNSLQQSQQQKSKTGKNPKKKKK